MKKQNTKIELINSYIDFVNDEKIWNEILEDNNNEIVFIEHGWIEQWWKHFGANYEMFILKVTINNFVIGFAPFMIKRTFPTNRIYFIGYPDSCYMNFVIRYGWDDIVVDSVLNYMGSIRGSYIYLLNGIQEHSTLYNILSNKLAVDKVKHYINRIQAYFINTSQGNFEDYYKERRRHSSINELRKQENRLNKLGVLTFEKYDDLLHLEEVFKLHEKRWYNRLDTSDFSIGENRKFFTKLFLDKNLPFQVRAYILKLDNRSIAFVYGFYYRNEFFAYRVSHDDDFYKFAPGKLIFKLLINKCFETGLDRFDFLAGYERYKAEWSDSYHNYCTFMFPSGKGSSLAIYFLTTLKDSLKTYLKKSSFIKLFVRNKIGSLKYYLSGRFLKSTNSISAKYLLTLIIKKIRKVQKSVFNMEKYHLYSSNNKVMFLPLYNFNIHTIRVEELERLSEIMDCMQSDITSRLFKGEKCYMAVYSGEIIGLVWTQPKNNIFSLMENKKNSKQKIIISEIYLKNAIDSDVLSGVIAHICMEYYSKHDYIIYVVIDEEDANVNLEEILLNLNFKKKSSIKIRTIVGHKKIIKT